jgi:hypothetical protein
MLKYFDLKIAIIRLLMRKWKVLQMLRIVNKKIMLTIYMQEFLYLTIVFVDLSNLNKIQVHPNLNSIQKNIMLFFITSFYL